MADKPGDAEFYAGILTALAVVALYDAETIFREIADSCNVDALVRHAKREGEFEWSGLKRYGYGKRKRKAVNHADL